MPFDDGSPDRKRHGHVIMTPWTVRWARIGAMLLLAAICGDLTNVHCDGPLQLGATPTLSIAASDAHESDPCTTTCVPDCFCCSRTEQSAIVQLRPDAKLLAPLGPDGFLRPASGVRPLPYHPPLNLL